jgi:predicted ATPase
MITNLEITNFKSIKSIKLDFKRINIFIGEPNTGKSNILECLSFFSAAFYSKYGSNVREFIRHEKTADLFYDTDIQKQVEAKISLDNNTTNSFTINFKDGQFTSDLATSQGGLGCRMIGDHNTFNAVQPMPLGDQFLSQYKFYKYVEGHSITRPEGGFLLPPSGSNLVSVLLTNKELRSLINTLISRYDLKLGLRPNEAKIELVKQAEDVIISYPFVLISDTFKRLIFFLAAVLTNKQSILIFEEPESHAFPYYTKYLAEKIVSDSRENQYFMSTHNPYFLQAAVARGNFDDMRIFVTRFKDYETTVTTLDKDDMSNLMQMDVDVFFRLDDLVSGKNNSNNGNNQ